MAPVPESGSCFDCVATTAPATFEVPIPLPTLLVKERIDDTTGCVAVAGAAVCRGTGESSTGCQVDIPQSRSPTSCREMAPIGCPKSRPNGKVYARLSAAVPPAVQPPCSSIRDSGGTQTGRPRQWSGASGTRLRYPWLSLQLRPTRTV
jgi:hypothetical protein